MNILILYFSGTGNTHFIAKKIRDSLSEHNVECKPVENFPIDKISKFDILIFGFPVYACSMPEFLKQFTNKFPLPKSGKIVLFSTYAYMPCNAMKSTADYFSTRGFEVSFAKGVKMPGSDGLLLTKKTSSHAKKLSKINFDDREDIKQFVNKVKNAVCVEKTPCIIQGNIFSSFASPLMKLFIPIENKLKASLFADETCIHCGICEEVCPVKNIKVTEKGVSFRNDCVLCLRCITQCPKEAIQIGKLTKGTVRWKGPNGDFNPLKKSC